MTDALDRSVQTGSPRRPQLGTFGAGLYGTHVPFTPMKPSSHSYFLPAHFSFAFEGFVYVLTEPLSGEIKLTVQVSMPLA